MQTKNTDNTLSIRELIFPYISENVLDQVNEQLWELEKQIEYERMIVKFLKGRIMQFIDHDPSLMKYLNTNPV
jgi:hypothetical protein